MLNSVLKKFDRNNPIPLNVRLIFIELYYNIMKTFI